MMNNTVFESWMDYVSDGCAEDFDDFLDEVAETAKGLKSGITVDEDSSIATLFYVETEDGKKLESAGIKRTMKKAVEEAISQFKAMGVNEKYLITVSHASVEEEAKKVVKQIEEAFVNTEIELVHLSCAFVTQGGPGCIAIQVIEK